jgi:hypothetical protein
MKITPFRLAEEECVNTMQVVELGLKNYQDNYGYIHCTGVISENCTQQCPCTTGIEQCVCMVGTKKHYMSWQKLMFACAVSHLQSFKGDANRFPGSMVTLWDMGSPFYSKWVVMQWIHPSSLRTTKCKVCQYVGRLLHLYSMLQESESYSYFEIQKWIWSYAMTCCADCIRLLAGRGMNICHEVWLLSTVIRIQYITSTRSGCSLEI